MFECKTVIMRRVANSLAHNALRQGEDFSVDIEKAKKQQEMLYKVFRDQLNLRVVMLDVDEKLPDCVFVEDVVIVIGKKALITYPGHPTRRPECKLMSQCFKDFPEIEVFNTNEIDPEAIIDGGDILFTGDEIFAGLSKRTNKAGHEVLQKVFNPLPVRSVTVSDELHLKSVLTLATPGKITVFTGSKGAKETVENFKSAAKTSYEYIEVEGKSTYANCVYLEKDGKGIVVYLPAAKKVFEKLDVPTKIAVDTLEFSKVDGCLTCLCVLLGV